MPIFIFRNYTLEPFFHGRDVVFSGYGDISEIPKTGFEKFVWFYVFPHEIESERSMELAKSYLEALEVVIKRLPKGAELSLVLAPMPKQAQIVLDDRRVASAVEFYNQGLLEFSTREKACQLVELDENFASQVDWRFYFMAQLPFSPKAVLSFKRVNSLERKQEHLPVLPSSRKKCLICDLDFTLWGGILGEEGASGIVVGGAYPGNAYSYFQKQIKRLAESGIVLAIVSKNNPRDVEEVFDKNQFLALKKQDFSVIKIGWKDKVSAIREIAMELNIGFDSLVFIDDDVRERELVRQILPEVEVPEFPDAAYKLPCFFESLLERYFRAATLTVEDYAKRRYYAENAERSRLKLGSTSFEDYLASLETVLTLETANKWTIPRLAQLSQKTNQFNLTTRRYTGTELLEKISAGEKIFSLKVKDRFGDSGIVGLAIITAPDESGNAKIDSFLLSCRVLGRRIEKDFLALVIEELSKSGNLRRIWGEYLPSLKNKQCENFYPENGFSRARGNDSLFVKEI